MKKIKYTLVLSFFILLSNKITAQDVEKWIDFERTYVKSTFSKSGIYRIYASDLALLPEAKKQAQYAQFYVHGVEIPSLKIGLEDNSLDENDYYELYLEAQNGLQDSSVYRPKNNRPPTNFNLYSDETALFISIGKTKGKDTPQNKTITNNTLLAEKYHLEKATYNYTNEWSFNNSIGLVPYLQHSYYENGESWTGKYILRDSAATQRFTLTDFVKSTNEKIHFNALLTGRNYVQHDIKSFIGNRQIGNNQFFGFNHFDVKSTIEVLELDASNSFIFKTQSPIKTELELYSWSKVEIIYPQSYSMKGLNSKIFYPQPSSNDYFLSIQNVPSDAKIYSIGKANEPQLITAERNTETLNYRITKTENTSEKIFVSNEFLKIKKPELINFKKISTDATYLFITHSSLLESVTNYANYRSSAAGGSHKTLIISTEQLYNQFNYGEKSPIAIRRFLEKQYNSTEKYLLLVGRAVSFPDVLKTWADRDLVPTFGYPGSDNLLSSEISSEDTPAFLTGRLNVTKNSEVQNYLEKVKEFESQNAGLWRKNVLHLNGGKSKAELTEFRATLESLSDNITASPLNGNVTAISKKSDEETEAIDISKEVNDGIGFISFIGHASPTVPDLNIGFASKNTTLNNKGKYPLMYFNGCGVGNIFYRYETLSTDWLLTPNKGAIAILANSFWSYTTPSTKYLSVFYENLFNDARFQGKSIGAVQQATLSEILSQKPNEFDIANAHQLVLQGDPAIKIVPFNTPDYLPTDVIIRSSNPILTLQKATKWKIIADIANAGIIQKESTIEYKIQIKTANNNIKDVTATSFVTTSLGTQIEIEIEADSTITEIQVAIDPANRIDESNKKNNSLLLPFSWNNAKKTTNYPAKNDVDNLPPILEVRLNGLLIEDNVAFSKGPEISIELIDNQSFNKEKKHLTVFLSTCKTCEEIDVSDKISYNFTDENKLLGKLETSSEDNEYTLRVLANDSQGNATNPYRITWRVRNDILPSVSFYPNPATEFVRFYVRATEKVNGKISLFSSYGKIVFEEEIPFAEGLNTYFLKGISAGSYIFKIQLGDHIETGKIYWE